MTDVHDIKTRSYNMSRIRGKDTKPELLVRKYLHALGYRFRLHNPKLPGKPDIVLPKYKTVVFIHGCFWHGHEGCKDFVIPKTRTEWWLNKISANKSRDVDNLSKLNQMGWKVIAIFECELKNNSKDLTFNKLLGEFY
jgi:DNA mismatch endonuclease, patch repair protein